MNGHRLIAFAIVVLAGAILLGCAAIAQSAAMSGELSGIAAFIGIALMLAGIASTVIEAAGLWGLVQSYLGDTQHNNNLIDQERKLAGLGESTSSSQEPPRDESY